MAQRLLEDHSPALMSMAIMKSREDRQMLRMLVGSIMRRGKQTPIKIGRLTIGTLEDLDRSSEAVLKKAAAGQISLDEAADFSTLIEARRRVLETRELERRISDLESAGGLQEKA